MLKKKLLFCLLAVCLLLAVGTAELSTYWNRRTITLYSQEDVISDRVLQAFTRETGISVQYELLNEENFTFNPAECDLLLADAEQLTYLLENDQLSELDWEQLSELPEINSAYLGLSYDPENSYTVPALWTTMGLLYNPAQTDTRVTGWANLFDGRFAHSLVMPSDSWTSFTIALAALGMDVNTQSEDDLSAAASYLTQQQSQVLAYCSAEQLYTYFQTGKTILAPCYAASAIGIMSNLSELSFVIPSEGSWQKLLSYAIPSTSEQKEAAYELLNYLCQKDNQAKNAAYSCYSVVCSEAYELLDSAWQANPLAYPNADQPATFPILQGQGTQLRTLRQVQWLLIQQSMELDTSVPSPADLIL